MRQINSPECCGDQKHEHEQLLPEAHVDIRLLQRQKGLYRNVFVWKVMCTVRSCVFMPMLSLVTMLALAALRGSLASDICQGPLVQIVVDAGSGLVTYFGVNAPFGGQLQLNETLLGTLVLASPQDACSPLELVKSGSEKRMFVCVFVSWLTACVQTAWGTPLGRCQTVVGRFRYC